MSGMPAAEYRGPRSVPFDARPLTDPIDRRALHAYTQRLRASGDMMSVGGTIAVRIVISVVFVGVSLGFLYVAGTLVLAFAVRAGANRGILTVVGAIIALGLVAFILTRILRSFGRMGERRYRLDHFAQANGMAFVQKLRDPELPGMVFGLGSSRSSSDLIRGTEPRFVEFGNYTYTTGSGKNKKTHEWGYVAVKLSVPLPHIVLDAIGNNGLFGSNLPAAFDKDQRLSLEGDFDRYFSLYCPAGYERDALYLFTPDIMARFIDNAAALDVEIVDDWLFLYAKRDFSTLDPAMWAWLFSVVAALLDKLAQWERWRDDRLPQARMPRVEASADQVPFAAPAMPMGPPPGVAPPGRRLKRGIPWVTFLFIGGFVLFWVISQSGLFAAVFGSLFGR